MPRHPSAWGQLREGDFALIDYVISHVVENDEIPRMELMAKAIGISRHGVIRRMRSMENRGIMRPRPKYAIRWFELTPLGEDKYIEWRKRMPRMRAEAGAS